MNQDFFDFFLTLDVRVSLHTSQLIPRDLEVNDQVSFQLS